MPASSATAFAPAAISNFFSPHVERDLRRSGATGGGVVLSKGTVSVASVMPGEQTSIRTTVDGDPWYPAKTTEAAVMYMMESARVRAHVSLIQETAVPIGCGFGASACSALSGVMATAAALGVSFPKKQLAYFAHVAEIRSSTGLGTVSFAYVATGPGAITKPGAPGVATLLRVNPPKKSRVVTATLAPIPKGPLLRSSSFAKRTRSLGDKALKRLTARPTFETLMLSGEDFAQALGQGSLRVSELISIAKSSGARFASQNMIGSAVHAIVPEDQVEGAVAALRAAKSQPRVDVYDFGRERAGLVASRR